MPKIKEPKKKPEILPCIFDRRTYEVFVEGKLVASTTSFSEAKRMAAYQRRLRKSEGKPRYPERIAIKLRSICTYGPEVCRFWKSCVESKGTKFTQQWGQKRAKLLEMKRQEVESKKDKELDRFL